MMTSFRIHEDALFVPKERHFKANKENKENAENKSKIPKKIGLAEKRSALQCVNNGVRQDNKRMKMGNKENEPSLQAPINTKKEDKPKLEVDSDLLKIVTFPSEVCKEKNAASLPSARSLTFTTEYTEEILKYYKEMEDESLPKSNYMDKQPHLSWNMRSILVDWLVCVAEEYSMSEDCLYLAVNYIDRFLSKISVVREKLQLVGSSAMMIAGKMEEIYPPMPTEWAYLTGDTYSKRQIIKMEQLIIKILEYKLQPPTCYTFLRKFCSDHDLDETTTNLALYLAELVLLEGKQYLKFKPSEIAAASILHARFNLMKQNIWPRAIEESSGYTVKHLSPIVKAQGVTLKESPFKKQQSIQDKYKSDKYGRVALLKPRSLKLVFSLESEVDEGSFEYLGVSEETTVQAVKV